MSVQTRSQRLAQAAFPRVQGRKNGLHAKAFSDYTSVAKRFPALLHACGLAQAVAFALAKKEREKEYVEDLAAVLKECGYSEINSATALDGQARTTQLGGYMRLSRDAIQAAGWLKRYAEALGEDADASIHP